MDGGGPKWGQGGCFGCHWLPMLHLFEATKSGFIGLFSEFSRNLTYCHCHLRDSCLTLLRSANVDF